MRVRYLRQNRKPGWIARAARLACAVAVIHSASSFAAVTWSFNWYCSECGRHGGRTTGTNGPFASREACESARSMMSSPMGRRGASVHTVACQSSGIDISQPQPEARSPAPLSTHGGGGYASPQQPHQQLNLDYEQQRYADEERRRREEETRQAEAEHKQRAEFAKTREEALRLLKGVSSGGLQDKGIQTNSKSGAPDTKGGVADRTRSSPRAQDRGTTKGGEFGSRSSP